LFTLSTIISYNKFNNAKKGRRRCFALMMSRISHDENEIFKSWLYVGSFFTHISRLLGMGISLLMISARATKNTSGTQRSLTPPAGKV
jgi:hypothetical protein